MAAVLAHSKTGASLQKAQRPLKNESRNPLGKRREERKRRERLERELELERSERQSEQSRREREAYARSEAKRQALRRDGGSRFNLRWKAPVDTIGVTPDYLMQKLQTYIDFGELEVSRPANRQHG
jgi:hypothetical protein